MEDKMLKLRPDTIVTIRKSYNFEHQAEIDQAVDSLCDWLKKQYHLTKREYPREYLERSIMLMKGSVEKTKLQIDRLCSFRTLLPKFFEKYDARNDYDTLNGKIASALLPQLTDDHYRVYVQKVVSPGITKKVFFDATTFGFLFCEYDKMYDYTNGIVTVFDYRDVNPVEYMASVDLSEMHSLSAIMMNGYAMRIKGIHVITSSKTLKSVVDIVKKMFGAKISSRFHVHDDVETLYEHIPKAILPSELGGDERSIFTMFEEWRDVFSTKENIEFFKEMKEAVSNDAGKMKEKLKGVDQELAGTFRSLTID